MSSSDPCFYDFMHRHLSVRERELRMIKDEYAFIQSCGGASAEDMAYFRASVLRHSRPPICIVKQEAASESSAPPLVSLKSMLLDIITSEQAENINKICRHVRPLLEREGIRTYCRHHATHVRSADLQRVTALLQKEGVVAADV
jgi:hypothetical protein